MSEKQTRHGDNLVQKLHLSSKSLTPISTKLALYYNYSVRAKKKQKKLKQIQKNYRQNAKCSGLNVVTE